MLALIAAALLLVPTAAAARPAHHAQSSPCAGAAERRDAARRAHAVRCLVNQARAAHGLRPLRENRALEIAAARHARDMVGRDFFGHTSPGGSTPSARARRAGYRGSVIGETIAFAIGPDATPAGTVRGWLRSSDHRTVLLAPDLRDAGVGIADGAPLVAGAANDGETVVLDAGAR